MSHVVEINSIDQLDRYWLAWRALLAQTPQASFFQSLDWLQVYWRHFGRRQKLRVLLVFSGGELIGILPLTVIRERTRLGPVRVLTYPLHDWGSFYGPIGPHPAATLLAASCHISRTRRDWDLFDLRWIDRQGVDRGRTATAMRLAGLACREAVWNTTAVIDLSSGWAEYVAARSSKFRNNIRRARRRVARAGRLRYQRYRPAGSGAGDDDPRWELYDACVDLAARSWQGSSTTGNTLSHAGVRAFFRQMHLVAAGAGALDLNVLWIDDQLVAFAYNYCWQGRLTGLRIGYDPRFAHLGLGTVLLASMLEDSCARGDLLLDLGPGSLASKHRWATRLVPISRCCHYRPGAWRSQLLRLKHSLTAHRQAAGELQPA